jgi:protein-disulfide isomerase
VKRQHIALIGGAVLILAFVFASFSYRSQQAEAIASAVATADSPLVRSHSPSKGPTDAKVILVEFFDPACETCRVFHHHVNDLLAQHPDKLRLVLRYAPLHQGSDMMVLILEAARRQGKFWETLDSMFATQPQWASHHQPQPELIWQFLPAAGVDVDRLRQDMNDPKLRAVLEQDIADGKTLNVRKTPQFFVNDKPLQIFGLDSLKALIDFEIAAKY